MAVSFRAEPRTTRDVDVAIAVSGDPQAEEICQALLSRGYAVEAVLEQTDSGRLATVRLQSPEEQAGGTVVDLLFASSGIEPEIVAAAAPLEVLPRHVYPVAQAGHLLAMKVLAARFQDLADAMALLERADADEMSRARQALFLIQERGYHRGKDLQAELDRLCETRPDRLG